MSQIFLVKPKEACLQACEHASEHVYLMGNQGNGKLQWILFKVFAVGYLAHMLSVHSIPESCFKKNSLAVGGVKTGIPAFVGRQVSRPCMILMCSHNSDHVDLDQKPGIQQMDIV